MDGSETLNVGINKDHSTLIVYPSIDAIQEIKVLTLNYGRRSKHRQRHDDSDYQVGMRLCRSIDEFFRNAALNAKGYFDVGNKAPEYNRNDFGGTIGGPIYIPHVYNGKGRRTFSFHKSASRKIADSYRQAVQSLPERNGDFSDVCPMLANGTFAAFSRAQYPDCPDTFLGNRPPQTFVNNQFTYSGNTNVFLNPNALAILSSGIFPLPNASSGCDTTGTACYLTNVPLPTYWRQELFRIDHSLNANWQATFRYIHDSWNETTPVPQYAYTQNTFPTIQKSFDAPGQTLSRD